MQFKRVFTMLTALGAIGTALAGTAGAKQLLIDQGWHIVNPNGPDQNVGETPPTDQCPNQTLETCAYYLDEAGERDPDLKLTFPM